jgi:transposase-like protein
VRTSGERRVALRKARPVAQVALESGIHPETLRGWRRVARAHGASETGASAVAIVPSLKEESRRLRRENERLREDREIPKRSDGLLRQGESMRFASIDAHACLFHIATMFRVLEVSKAGS